MTATAASPQTFSSRLSSLPELSESRFSLPAVSRVFIPKLPASLPTPPRSENIDTVTERLWNLLPFSRLNLALAYDRTELARAYADSYQRLQQAQEEIAGMLEDLCGRATVERWDQRTSKETRKEWRRRLRESVSERMLVPIVPPDSELTAQRVGEPGLANRLSKNLQERTRQFAEDLFESLDAMVGTQLLGRITWTTDKDCFFTFHRHGLTQEFVHRDRAIKREFDAQPGRNVLITRDQETVRNTSSLLKYEHHLMDAQQHDLHETVFPIPQPILEFLKLVPEWLQPMVRIVEGTQIQERVCEFDGETTEWTSPVRETRRVIFHNDPALVLGGEHVLLAWGQQEVEAETKRQHDLKTAAEAAWATESRSAIHRLVTALSRGSEGAALVLGVLATAWRSPLCAAMTVVLSVASTLFGFFQGSTESPSPKSSDIKCGLLLAGRKFGSLAGFQLLLLSIVWSGWALLLSGICAAVSFCCCSARRQLQ